MADVISLDPHASPFHGLPFPAVPWGLYNGRPWFFPDGGWYKLLDWVT